MDASAGPRPAAPGPQAGAHAPRRRRLATALVTIAALALLALGWWAKARCLPGGWVGGQQYLQWCYTDIYALYFDARLDVGALPYRDHPLEYPPLTGAQLWAAAEIVRGVSASAEQRAAWFFHVTAAGGVLAIMAAIGVLAAAGVPARRLVWFAGAPALATTALINWDPVPVLALTGAVVAHVRGRDGLAGVAAGLGAAAKLFPGLLVPLVVAARLAQRRVRDAALHAGAAGAAWAAVNLPVAAAWPQGWWEFAELSRRREANFDSLWYLGEQLAGARVAPATLNNASLVWFVAIAAAVCWVGARRRDPGAWWQLALPLLCAFLLTNKVYSPQYTLWLLPLLALAAPSWRPVWAVLVTDLVVFAVEFPFLGGVLGFQPAPGYPWLAAAVVARAAALAWLLVATTAHPADWTRPARRASPGGASRRAPS